MPKQMPMIPIGRHTAAKVYHQYINGDTMKTSDIKKAIPVFRSAVDSLLQCGPAFRLAYADLNRLANNLDDILEARARK